jgi:N-acetylmuramoyl-L-alanine amidase
VVIDPGHNGANGANPAIINQLVPAGGFTKPCDTTGTETNAGYSEAAFNFDVATRMEALLSAKGIKWVATRTNNTGVGPCVNQRAAIGNAAHADAAISIHADGGPATGRGFHVIQPALLPGYTDRIVGPSQQLALAVRTNYLLGTGMPLSTYAGTQGLSTRADLGGLNLSTVPKVFIECGNMRNATDAALLTSADFRQKVAEALAQGIEAYLATLPRRTG